MSAFVFQVEMKCLVCDRDDARTLRLRPFEDRLIEKQVGCKECGDSLLMYFYKSMEDEDDDGNGDVYAKVRRIE